MNTIARNLKELDDCIPVENKTLSLPGSPLVGKEKYVKLYHTTSLNSFLLIWAKKRLKFAALTGVNDMKEFTLSIGSENPQLLPVQFAMQDVRKSYRQISFTMDFDTSIKGYASPLIWGVYGDKNNGVCIELDYKKLKLPKNCMCDMVEYVSTTNHRILLPKDVVSVNTLKRFINERQKELFFTKDKCWEHENEYRIISDTDDYLDISDAITAVYVANIDGLSYEIVEELLQNSKIKFGYVHVDNKTGVLFSSDARQYRDSCLQNEKSDNCLMKFGTQAKEYYEKYKNNPNADLTKIIYSMS